MHVTPFICGGQRQLHGDRLAKETLDPLTLLTTSMIKHYDQKQVREKRVNFIFYFQIAVHHLGKSGQELVHRPWRIALTGLLLMVCSACFAFIQCPHWAGPSFPHQPAVKVQHRPVRWGKCLTIKVLSQVTQACVKLTKAASAQACGFLSGILAFLSTRELVCSTLVFSHH